MLLLFTLFYLQKSSYPNSKVQKDARELKKIVEFGAATFYKNQ